MRVQELSLILSFQPGKDILVRPPIFRYLGHTIAHLSWAQKARDEVMAMVEANLARYRALPLNVFERVQLLNSVLIPQ